MSTHNHLMRLGNSAFLEVISIDPDAPAPARTRWFDLDDPAMRARLALSGKTSIGGEPMVSTWR